MFPASAGKAWRKLNPIHFIAAVGDPSASTGTDATAQWGIWRVDPGPRGVPLASYPALSKAGHRAKAGWLFDVKDFWIEEHGRLMEPPEPLPPGRYIVTGDREATVPLNVAANGDWKLEGGAKLVDVTHLPCRSARYVANQGEDASPLNCAQQAFPVRPGGLMPAIRGYGHKDYAVVFVLAVEE
jgi:hypothetical protein